MAAKKLTIEDLAVMVKKGFDQTATRQYVDERFKSVDEKFKLMIESMDFMRADIRDIKITLGPLVRMVAALDVDVRNLQHRMGKLEKRAGVR